MRQAGELDLQLKEMEVVEIMRDVYGLNSAPRAWHNTLRKALLEAGWSQSALDPCLYVLRQGRETVGACIVYVDDLAVQGRDSQWNLLKKWPTALEGLCSEVEKVGLEV